jgi:predicted CXXCH cytochrome family protein
VITGLFLAGLVVKERDDRFCVACHLHEEKFKRFTARASSDLAGFHHRKDATVGCIACHGGATALTRATVWTVAGVDTLRFLAGAYAEPTRMRVSLGDADCGRCHTPILAPRARAPAGAEPQSAGNRETNYHAIRDHGPVNVRCVRCHTSHTTDSDERNRFISRSTIQPVCRECHKEM